MDVGRFLLYVIMLFPIFFLFFERYVSIYTCAGSYSNPTK